MVFGSEAVLPADIAFRAPRVENYKENSDQARLVEVDSLEEELLVTCVRMAKYLDSLCRYYNRNVNNPFFVVGDLVLCKKQKTDGMQSSPHLARVSSSSRRSPDQGPIDYATWMKEMSQTLGTSICLDVSTPEALIPKICTFNI